MQIDSLQKRDSLIRAFDPPRGVTALVGGGGKTTLMLRLARELAGSGARVIVTTTTHIYPPGGMPTLINVSAQEIENTFAQEPIVCLGTPAQNGKLSAPAMTMREMEHLADYVLVEADGAKGLPLKAPAGHEPVIPPEARLVIAVAGLDGLGKPISEAAFRPALYAAICGKQEKALVTKSDIARVLAHPEGQRKGVSSAMRYCVLLSKADDPERQSVAWEIAGMLKDEKIERIVIASLSGDTQHLKLV